RSSVAPRRVRGTHQALDAAAHPDAVLRAMAVAHVIYQTYDFYGLGGQGLRATSAGTRAGALQPAPTMGPSPPRRGNCTYCTKRLSRQHPGRKARRPLQATSLAVLPRRTR